MRKIVIRTHYSSKAFEERFGFLPAGAFTELRKFGKAKIEYLGRLFLITTV